MEMCPVRFAVVRVTLAVLLLGFTPFARALDINGDGMDDIWQEFYGIAPFDGRSDPDGDGIINLVESIAWSDPHDAGSGVNLVVITDVYPADGLDDYWQARYGISQAQKLDDPDGDGRTNLEESIVGSDPFTWDSPWQQNAPGGGLAPDGPDFFTLSLARSIPAMRYRLQSSGDLITWETHGWAEFHGDGAPRAISVYTGGVPRQFYRFVLDQPDDDGDGLINWHEWILGTDPYSADTDGDGLTDSWEVAHGLDPTAKDTDGDGVDDGDEVAANTDAKSNQSHPPVWRTIERTLRYDFDDYPPDQGGRHGTLTTSGSWENSGGGTVELTSEIAWTALAARLGADVPFPQTKPASTGTQITSNSYANLLPNPPCYHATLRHRRVWLEVKPAPSAPITSQVLVITLRSIDGLQPITAAQTITATIPAEQTLSGYSDLTPTFTSNPGGNAYHSEDIDLLPVDLDIVHPYGGELDEGKQHDPLQGGLVAVKRGDFTKPEGARDEPVTKLLIRANTSMQGLKWKLRFNGGTDFKLWKDVERTQSVVSDQTEFNPAQDVTLFFEGLKKSGAVGAESVKLLAVINGNSIEADTIYFTVVEAQILVQVRFWIREGWIPCPWHPTANPLLNKIVGGDRRDNSLDWEPGLGTPPLGAAPGYRVAQEAVLQPFKELNPGLYSGQRSGSATNRSGVSSIFYKPTSVPSPSLPYSATNELLATATPSSIAAPSTSRMHIDSSRTNDRTATIRFYGAASDPLILGSADIDWDLNVSIDATDPLNLKYAIDGSHDDYPAVEINMKLDAKDPAPTTTPFTTSPQPYFWLHPLPSNVFALANGSAITISPPKRGDVK